jgi:hypothetical protein
MPFETDKSNGFKFDASDLLKTGVFPEAFDRRIPMWETVNGVQYTEFGMKRKAGRQEIADFGTGLIRGITAVRETLPVNNVLTADRLAYAGSLTKIYRYKSFDNSTLDVSAGKTYGLLEDNSATTWTHGDGGSPNAVDVWDGGDTVWDNGVNEAETWSFETFGSFIMGAKDSTQAQIKKGHETFADFYKGKPSGFTITAGGSGYAVGDTIVDMELEGTSTNTNVNVTITGQSGGVATHIKVDSYGDYTTFTNSSVIDGGTAARPGGGSPGSGLKLTIQTPDCKFDGVKIFHKQGPHMLAFNYNRTPAGAATPSIEYPTTFAWCSADNLDTWEASASNTAGSLQIREANTPIVCVAQLGNGLAAYTENQMFIINYVGLPNIFGYRPALENNVGAVSPHSVVTVGRKNYGLSRDGFFVTDGSSVKMIGRESGMNEWYRENIAFTSSSQLGIVVAYDNPQENEVVWAMPRVSLNIQQEIYYNYKTNQWGMRDSSRTAFLERSVFNYPISADGECKLYFEGSRPDLPPGTIVSAITKAHDLGDADRVKEFSAMRVGKEGDGSPQLYIAATDVIDQAPDWLTAENFTINNKFESFPLRTAGRYIHLKIESTGGNDWIITDLVVQGRFEGER